VEISANYDLSFGIPGRGDRGADSLFFWPSPAVILPSNYERYGYDSLNQPEQYPAAQSVPEDYLPVGDWVGRLILVDSALQNPADRVRFEVYHAPAAYTDLVGQTVWLTWQDREATQALLQATQRSVEFTPEAKLSHQSGILHPVRLDGGNQVGPLESLAGAHPLDDVIVTLQGTVEVNAPAQAQSSFSLENNANSDLELMIAESPVQVSERFYGLVTIRRREGGDRFQVQHFSTATRKFDGALETLLIPQLKPDRANISRFSTANLDASPFNPTGWYIYGAKNQAGIFVVRAILPRSLVTLPPDDIALGLQAGKRYLHRAHWQDTPGQKGTGWTQLLDPVAPSPESAMATWQEGSRAIVMHLFGGIGGEKAEPTQFGVVTGHFSFGVAEVVRDPLSQELRFAIRHHQVYAHNPDGIIAGKIQWDSYMGDLQRGWLGNRPVSEVLAKLDEVTQDYWFGGIHLSPLAELENQLTIMTARYRVGDGTGASIVTPATSCVQDSSQALYITIKKIEQQVMANPDLQTWLQQHPEHPETARFQRLVALGRSLEKQLVPLGIVRPDWQQNVDRLQGTRPDAGTLITLWSTLTSWRTVLPRRAHDELSRIFLEQDSPLWIIRTNQIGGEDDSILPLAPTIFLGRVGK
jgi:predicted Abi (CAAX) family protease